MWNDKESDIDLLGHDKLAQTIIEIINDSNLRPLTIGVYGDWGVGKSSILALLQAKITEQKKLAISKTHYILFNGWLFQGYEDSKSALMETVVTELQKLQPADEKVKKLAKSLLRRINWLKVAKVSTNALLTGITGLPIGGLLGEIFTKVQKVTEGEDDEKLLKEEEDKTVTSQIHAFRKEFKELIESSKIEHIIILVDDLDRCLPKTVIEVLEAIRLFLFVEGTTFVISADERMIEYAVREHFPNLPPSYTEYTKNYLEKLIQIPIRIPTLNRLQTGNYIRLLMLQNYLKNDLEKLMTVYTLYEKRKSKPYEPLELDHGMVNEALGDESQELNESLSVASQIAPTLTLGLKGNPRNIKRFLNTLFLRMRIARIYGLENLVQVRYLAKLMLLERFHPELFQRIVDEVSASENGGSVTITEIEKDIAAGDDNQADGQEKQKDTILYNWAKIEPGFGATDLHPYIYISKEKAVSFDTGDLVPIHLEQIYTDLKIGSLISLNKAEGLLPSMATKDRILLYEKLLSDCRAIGEYKNMPAPAKGIMRILKIEQDLEINFVRFLSTLPANTLGPWSVAELSGIKNAKAIEKFNSLIDQWSKQSENKILQAIALQTIKSKKL